MRRTPDDFKSKPVPGLKIAKGITVQGFRFTETATASDDLIADLVAHRTDPIGYAKKYLGFVPWSGRNQPGQRELFQDIAESVKAQLAGEPATRIFRVEAGHGVGKTYGAGALVNWFFDCFRPSITTTTAPTREQVENLLWKVIKTLRPRSVPGRVLPGSPRLELAPNHFAFGRTTNDNAGRGSERLQGQHDTYLLFVVDEAEGVGDFVFDAIKAMMTGGAVIIVLLIGNPRTRSSRFHKIGKQTGVKNYRLSVLNFPNVLDGKDTIPGGTSRLWVMERIIEWCEVVGEHDPDEYTFELPFEVVHPDASYSVGTIFKPNAEFLFRVMGVAPANLVENAFVTPGRYEAAKTNPIREDESEWATIGVDCARFGTDKGTIYVRHAGVVWRHAQVSMGDTMGYFTKIRDVARTLAQKGAKRLSIRVDGTGGFGAGVVDKLKGDMELRDLFAPEKDGEAVPGHEYKILEVHFGENAYAKDKYDDIVTEMYAEAAESLKGIRLGKVPNELEEDLTERLYEFVNRDGRDLKKLHKKDKFKKDHENRSPDDGDGFVLCVAPAHIFTSKEIKFSFSW